MRTIVGLTAAYALSVAVAAGLGSSLSDIAFGEAMFAGPMFLACLLAIGLRRSEARQALLNFQLVFCAVSLLIYVSTFIGEQDAQYQLALLFIPMFGFPGVVIAGAIAVFLHVEQART